MDVGNFTIGTLKDLEILPAKDELSKNIPTPDQLPQLANVSHLPEDILKTSAIENLISQNEDLMARLKVNLRRLALMETENKALTEDNQKLKLAYSSMADQLLVHREKDGSWKEKISEIESQKLHLESVILDLESQIDVTQSSIDLQVTEKTATHRQEISVLNQKIAELNENLLSQAKSNEANLADLDRHKRYHDKIRLQVKPFIENLKDQNQKLSQTLEEQNAKLQIKDSQIESLRQQVIKVTENAKNQIQIAEKSHLELVQHYEQIRKDLANENNHLAESLKFYEQKSLKLDRVTERNDLLENQLVAARRDIENLISKHDSEITKAHEKSSHFRSENMKKDIFIQQLTERLNDLDNQVTRFKENNLNLTSQLDSLRYMYSEKSNENSTLLISVENLERLNAELSAKLNAFRTSAQL
jgi:chromosome segregation ATPase